MARNDILEDTMLMQCFDSELEDLSPNLGLGSLGSPNPGLVKPGPESCCIERRGRAADS